MRFFHGKYNTQWDRNLLSFVLNINQDIPIRKHASNNLRVPV